jgi:hypothetical protein
MKAVRGLRTTMALFVAVLMPLELGHCALMPLQAWAQASAVTIESQHHDDGDDCCPESATSPEPTSPADPCCCAFVQLPAATTPASVSVAAPESVPAPLAVAPIVAAAFGAQNALVRLAPDERSASPPDPSTASQSPRSPPYSA